MSHFPSLETCRVWIDFAEEHLQWIDGRITLFPADRHIWQEYRLEVVGRRKVWIDLLEARRGGDYWTSARERLLSIRWAVGEDAYASGYVLPPVEPLLLRRSD